MLSDFLPRIETLQENLALLLKAPSIKYSDWPLVDKHALRRAAGVYHYFEMADGHIRSVYAGKAGFGRQKDMQTWSLYERMSQHFLPSQKHALLGKASRKLGYSPVECKKLFLKSDLRVQWLPLHETCPRCDLESELFWLEYFAISILRPEYTDG
jgi:hypothetical protein